MAAMMAMAFAGKQMGVGFDKHPFTFSALPANLLLIHAWGMLPTVYWNFPSWMLSAEFAGCVSFPALMLLARRPAQAALALALRGRGERGPRHKA
jgi:peptidoglycan/LPS O-acetylase OafA/YrhL